MRFFLRSIYYIVICCLWTNSIALAALPITADGTTNTQVTKTASGVDQVNIAAPNASGLSHNKFTDYNVNTSGLILNNSTGHSTGVVSTAIGGLVVDNANLASSGAARVILNEVTSSNTSQILGYTEIAGTGAKLILANPNGFSFNGAGFINVSKLTAVVGNSNTDNPSTEDLRFSLTSLDKYVIDSAINSGFLPKITITGLGLDLESVSSTALVSSLMEIVAPIYAGENEVNILSGDASFDYSTSTVTSNANINPNPTDESGDPIEEIAIDASSLGEISAGKIFIIATKEGFGVKFSNDMIATIGGVSVDVAGDITYNNISTTSSDVSLKAGGNINGSAGSLIQAVGSGDVDSVAVNIEAGGSITNSGTIKSSIDLAIMAESDIHNMGDIIADGNLSLTSTASDINNDGNISSLEAITLTANLGAINNKSGSSLGYLVLTNSETSETTEIFSKTINLNALTLNNKGLIQSKETVAIAVDDFVNGFALTEDGTYDVSNDDVKLKSGTDLTITAIHNIDNYARIISDNDIIISSVYDLNNYHEISAHHDVEMTVINDLNNLQGALIWSNNDSSYNVTNNFSNNKHALIFANNNLTIQKNSAADKTKVTNSSGNITAYTGNVNVDVDSFENIRSDDPFLNLLDPLNGRTETAREAYYNRFYVFSGAFIPRSQITIETDRTYLNSYTWDRSNHGCFGHECGNRYNGYYAKALANPDSISSDIFVGGNLNIQTDTFLNKGSNINAIGAINIETGAGGFKNEAYVNAGYYKHTIGTYSLSQAYFITFTNNGRHYSDHLDYTDYSSSVASSIKSQSSITITQAGATDASLVNGVDVIDYATLTASELSKGKDAFEGTFNDISPAGLQKTGIVEVNVNQYLESDAIFFGDIKRNTTNPNKPVFERRGEFTKLELFHGGDYYFDLFGEDIASFMSNLDNTNSKANRMFGDAYVDTKLLGEQLSTLRSDAAFLSDDETDITQEIKSLMDNAATEIDALGLDITDIAINGLTQAQADLLTRDIIVYETQDFNGISVVVPKIYLSLKTRHQLLGTSESNQTANLNTLQNGSLAMGSTIFAAGDLTINTPNMDVINNGSLKSNSNIVINAKSLTNKTNSAHVANITATNPDSTSANSNIDITTTNDIQNISASMKASNALNLTSTDGDIINSAVVITNDKALLDSNSTAYQNNGDAARTSGTISSILLNSASLEGGSVTINAANDFTNSGANITANQNILGDGSVTDGNLSITAGDDITIETLKLRNRRETHWGSKSNGGTTITDITTNDGSHLAAAGSVLISSGSDTNVIGSSVEASDNIEIDAGRNIDLEKTIVASGTKVAINAINNIHLFNSNIRAQNDIAMHANNIKNIYQKNSDNQNQHIEAKIESGGTISLNATQDTEGNGGNISNIGATIESGDLLYLRADNDIHNLALMDYSINGSNSQFSYNSYDDIMNNEVILENSNANRIRSSLVSKGNLISGGNLVLIAKNNINNKASNITAAGSALLEATNGDVNITTATKRDRTVRRWWSKKNRGMSIKDATTNLESAINITGDLAIISGSDTNILGSDVIVGGSLTTDSTGDLNIASVQDSSYSFYANYKRGSFGSRSKSTSESRRINNRESDIDVMGDVNSTSLADINIIASNLTSSAGSINLIAKNDINIFSDLDTYYLDESRGRRGQNSNKGTQDITKTVRNITSDIDSANDLSITSGGNTTIIASNLSATNNGNIIVGKYLDVDTDIEIINADSTLTMMGAKDSDYSYHYDYSMSMDLGAIAVGATVGFLVGGPAGGVAGAYAGSQAKEGGINMVEIYDETIISTKLDMGNDLNISVASDVNLISADLDATNNINITAGELTDKDGNVVITDSEATINIAAFEEVHTRKESHQKLKVDYVGVAAGAAISAAVGNVVGMGVGTGIYAATGAAAFSIGVGVGSSAVGGLLMGNMLQEITQKTRKSNFEEEIKLQNSSNLNAGNDINLNSQGGINLSASNIISDNDIKLTADLGAINIASAVETHSTKTSNERQGFDDVGVSFNRGRTSLDVNGNILEETETISKLTNKSSNIRASKNIIITSQDDINILASNLSTTNDITKGEVNLTSSDGNVNILSQANTTTTFKERKEGTITLSAGIGSAHVDTAYAVDDLVKAGEAVKDAKQDLNRIETMHKNGQATDNAVKDAETNLEIAVLKLLLAEMKMAVAATKSAASCGDSLCTGLYADLQLNVTGSKTTTNTKTVANVASSISANNADIIINSGLSLLDSNALLIAGDLGNTNITGSHISANSGDIIITSKSNTNIKASENTYKETSNSESWGVNTTLLSTSAMGAGAALDNMINNLEVTLGAGLNMSDSETSINSTTYNNATITAYNGDVSISSIGILDVDGKNINDNTGNTLISGANIIANNTTINSTHDLIIESKQNSYNSNSESSGFNLGVSNGAVSVGINNSDSKTDRLWVDNQTTLLGTNSITINTGSDSDITGALIANVTNAATASNKEDWIDGGNLVINTNSLTYADLNDYDYSESIGFSFSTTIGAGLDGTSGNPLQDLNFYPAGSTRIALNNQSSEKEQLTKATIGNGNINLNSDITFNAIDGKTSSITGQIESSDSAQLVNLNRNITNSQEITKDLITGALDVDVTIDNRIFAAAAEGVEYLFIADGQKADVDTSSWDQLKKEFFSQKKNIGKEIRFWGEASESTRKLSEEYFGPIGTLLNLPLNVIEQLPHFAKEDDTYLYVQLDQKDYNPSISIGREELDVGNIDFNFDINSPTVENQDGDFLNQFVNDKVSDIPNIYFYEKVDDASVRRDYAVNGISTPLEIGFNNYLGPEGRTNGVLRHNPTHGPLGDLLESGVGHFANLINQPRLVDMNKKVAHDLYQRYDVLGGGNLFHSQGTIIGTGGAKLFQQTYQIGFDLDGNRLAEGPVSINNSQTFRAVGPAIWESSWNNVILGFGGYEDVGEKIQYKHDPFDSIQYLASPTMNPLDIPVGIILLPFIGHHDVTNKDYIGNWGNGDKIESSFSILPDSLINNYQLDQKND